MYKERKEITHGEIGEMITTSSYIYKRDISTIFAITKWLQDVRDRALGPFLWCWAKPT